MAMPEVVSSEEWLKATPALQGPDTHPEVAVRRRLSETDGAAVGPGYKLPSAVRSSRTSSGARRCRRCGSPLTPTRQYEVSRQASTFLRRCAHQPRPPRAGRRVGSVN
jgi:ribosomal protein S14